MNPTNNRFYREPVKERPILMSAPMVRATLREVDPKTQTRRAINPQPLEKDGAIMWTKSKKKALAFMSINKEPTHIRAFQERMKDFCPYGKVGDKLWVRESFFEKGAWKRSWNDTGCCGDPKWISDEKFFYAADGEPPINHSKVWRLRPSIHMRRTTSRILLEITAIRVERLQDISEADARAEGYPTPPRDHDGYTCWEGMCRSWYEGLWGRINGDKSWAQNPWVWVVEYKRSAP